MIPLPAWLYVRYSPLRPQEYAKLAESYAHSYFTPQDDWEQIYKRIKAGQTEIHTPSLLTLSGTNAWYTFDMLLKVYDAGGRVTLLDGGELGPFIKLMQEHRARVIEDRELEVKSKVRRGKGRPTKGITLAMIQELDVKGWSQGRIAEKLGCSERHVKKVRRGEA